MKIQNIIYVSLIGLNILSSCESLKKTQTLENYVQSDTIQITKKSQKTEEDFINMLKNFDGEERVLFENQKYTVTLFEHEEELKLYNTKKTEQPVEVNSTFEGKYGISYQRATELVNRANVLGLEEKSIEEIVNGFMQVEQRVFKDNIAEYYTKWREREIEDEQAQVNKLNRNIGLLRHAISVNTGKDRSKLEKELKANLNDLRYWKKELAEARMNFSKELESTGKYVNSLNVSNKDEEYKLSEFKKFLEEEKTEVQNKNNAVEAGIYKVENEYGYIYVVATRVSLDSITKGSHEVLVTAINQAQDILLDYASNFSNKPITSTNGAGVVWGFPEKINDGSGKEVYKVKVCFARVGSKKTNQKVLDSLEEYKTE